MKSLRSGLLACILCASLMFAMAAPQTAQADEAPPGDGHTAALSVWMLSLAVLASPVTYGGSFALMTVAWPAVVGSATAFIGGAQAASKPSRS